MPRILIVVAAFLSLAVPAALAAPPADKGKPESPGNSAAAPGQSADKNAAKKCKAERGTTAQSIAAFKEKYGTNKNKANAFGKCVSGMAKKLEAQAAEEEAEAEAKENAAKECKKLSAARRSEHRRVQGEVRNEQEQGERLRQVRVEAREGQEHVVS